jgi:phosphotriesterase-related protein
MRHALWGGIIGALAVLSTSADDRVLMTTQGPIQESAAGLILPHEHLFTDLRGPDQPGHGEADKADVVRVMKPLLDEASKAGVETLIECTTIGVGRNVAIVAALARESRIQVVVPTGVYGRAQFARPAGRGR